MKTLKFADNLVPLVLSGKKSATWRPFDDKDLTVGDELSLLNKQTKEEFAKAVIVKIVEKKLGDIVDADFYGHETYPSVKAMYDEYHSYYGDKISPETVVKMIDFKLIK